MIQTNDLGGLRAFVTVADLASFSRAAEGLGVSSSALSQTIRGLEERVGTRLLHRTTRSVSPTEAGAALLSQVRPALAALESAFDHARRAGRGPSGIVRVHCFRAAADLFIAPILASFHNAFPDIVLDLTIDDAVVDLVQGGFDVGIRVAELIERDMVAVRLGGDLRQIAVASPAYVTLHGAPRTPQDLLRHRCIRWRWPGQTTPYAWEFNESGRWFSIVVKGPLIASSRELGLRAALDGVGIAFVKINSVADEIAQGRLVPLLERWSAPFAGFFLCYPQQRHMAPGVRAFIDALRKGIGNKHDADL